MIVIGWAALAVLGVCKLEGYAGAPGRAADAPSRFPSASAASLDADQPTLVMFIHPKCPCSRATIGELNRLMARCQGRLHTRVWMVRPEGEPEGWEQTDLYRTAAAIPGVTVRTDVDGRECQRFGAATSGQVLLFATNGELLFSGGITAARGHSGDNDGRSAIEAILAERTSAEHRESHADRTAVFGCSLLDESCPRKQESDRPAAR